MAHDAGTEKVDRHTDEPTLNMLELTLADMISGKEKTYTLEQTFANIQEYRSKQEISHKKDATDLLFDIATATPYICTHITIL